MAFIVLPSAALLAVLLLIPQLFGDFTAYQIGLFLIYGIAAQGIGFLWGKTGILPLGQAMFFGGSAYACAQILKNVNGLTPQIAMLVAVVVAVAIIAFVLAAIVFKGRSDSGPFFSLITLALVMISEQVAGTATEITGGFNGFGGFPVIANLNQFGDLYYVIAATAVLSTALLITLNRLPAGLVARAVADNEKRLQLFGFPTHMIKGLVFALSAALAAIAGILFANHQGIVTPTSTGFILSANLVIWTAVGGRFHVFGPLIGAVGIGYLSSELRDSFAYWEVALALIFIVVVLKAPGGVSEFIANLLKRLFPKAVRNQATHSNFPSTNIATDPSELKFSQANVKVGSVRILNGVDLTTPVSGIVCIIGPNGAGKTSLLNVMAGGLTLFKGSVSLGEEKIQNRAPHKALKSGIARKLQVPSVFFSLSVFENLALSMLAGRARFIDYFRPSALHWRTQQIEDLLSTPALPLQDQMYMPVSDLAQGHRQFLEFAMTTSVQPRVLLLDEPCAGLSPDETHLMTKLVQKFQDQNKGLIILIEHDMSIVRELADKVIVLHQGAILSEGTYEEIRSDKAVQEVYAGGSK